jgi:hypothetical protein
VTQKYAQSQVRCGWISRVSSSLELVLNLNVLREIVLDDSVLYCTESDVINTCKSFTAGLAVLGTIVGVSLITAITICLCCYVRMLKRVQGYNNLEGVVNAGEGDGVRNQ